MKDKVVVITGVTSGIGGAVVSKLVAQGARVIGLARDAEKLRRVREKWGSGFSFVAADLSLPESRRQALGQLEAVGPVDALIHNAAGVLYETPLHVELEAWRRLFELNFWSVVELTRALVSQLKPDGQIVNVSSVTARSVPQPKFEPYALTKAALEHWTASLREELSPRKIKVSLLVPGLVDTAIYDKVQGFERMRAKLEQHIPQWLTADDVADALLFLLNRPAHVVIRELVLSPQGQ